MRCERRRVVSSPRHPSVLRARSTRSPRGYTSSLSASVFLSSAHIAKKLAKRSTKGRLRNAPGCRCEGGRRSRVRCSQSPRCAPDRRIRSCHLDQTVAAIACGASASRSLAYRVARARPGQSDHGHRRAARSRTIARSLRCSARRSAGRVTRGSGGRCNAAQEAVSWSVTELSQLGDDLQLGGFLTTRSRGVVHRVSNRGLRDSSRQPRPDHPAARSTRPASSDEAGDGMMNRPRWSISGLRSTDADSSLEMRGPKPCGGVRRVPTGISRSARRRDYLRGRSG